MQQDAHTKMVVSEKMGNAVENGEKGWNEPREGGKNGWNEQWRCGEIGEWWKRWEHIQR